MLPVAFYQPIRWQAPKPLGASTVVGTDQPSPHPPETPPSASGSLGPLPGYIHVPGLCGHARVSLDWGPQKLRWRSLGLRGRIRRVWEPAGPVPLPPPPPTRQPPRPHQGGAVRPLPQVQWKGPEPAHSSVWFRGWKLKEAAPPWADGHAGSQKTHRGLGAAPCHPPGSAFSRAAILGQRRCLGGKSACE